MIRTLLILAMACANVYADEPLTFKSLRIGSDKSTVLAALPGAECADGKECRWPAFSYGGVDLHSVSAAFSDGKLVSITGFISSDDFSTLIAAMAERFGKRAKVTEGRVQNRMGAVLRARTVRWAANDTWLQVQERVVGLQDQGMIDFGSAAGNAVSERKYKEATREGAKDL